MNSKSEWRAEMRRRLTLVNSENESAADLRRERLATALGGVLTRRPGLWLAFAHAAAEPNVVLSTAGVTYAFPRIENSTALTFYTASATNGRTNGRWMPNQFGIQEPDVTDSSWRAVKLVGTPPDAVRGALIPCLGFDRRLRRLGRGGGFYDRFLKDSSFLKVGVGFAEQLVDELPHEPHDIDLDGLITDRDVIWKVSAAGGRLKGH